MVELVERMLELHKQLPKAKTPRVWADSLGRLSFFRTSLVVPGGTERGAANDERRTNPPNRRVGAASRAT